MKTFEACVFVAITLFQLALSDRETCGAVRTVQVSDEKRNDSKLHFPWAGALYSVVNRTKAGEFKYICGATLISECHSITGKC